MKEYSYKDIQKITKVSILFKNEFEILFEECNFQNLQVLLNRFGFSSYDLT